MKIIIQNRSISGAIFVSIDNIIVASHVKQKGKLCSHSILYGQYISSSLDNSRHTVCCKMLNEEFMESKIANRETAEMIINICMCLNL